MSQAPTVSALMQRALHLMSSNRPGDAERELRRLLAADPSHAWGHAALALCLLDLERLDEAQGEAAAGIAADAEDAFAHYAMHRVMMARNRFDEARAAIEAAIQLDPADADYYGSLAVVLLRQRRREEALAAAERGLALDPEHVGCANLRSMVLVQLGRREEAGASMESALRRDPDNALTHANRGWALLHANQPKEAMQHFREALRLEPQMEWARAGILEALRARNIIYRLMLMYFMWMSRLGRGTQWGLIIGAYMGYRMLSNLADRQPEIAVYLRPILWAYMGFVFLSWAAKPLFNLLLRIDRFGRLILSREERIASNCVGGALLAAAALAGYGAIGGDEAFLFGGLGAAFLIIPISGTASCEAGWPRWTMLGITAFAAFLVVAAIALHLVAAAMGASDGLAAGLLIGSFIVVFISGWVANYLAGVTPKR